MNTVKRKRIFLLCGIPWPGSGKSTWIKQQIEENGGIWCSRDEVRFSLLEDDENYFAKENKVFSIWINNIRDAIRDPEVEDVYIDATHISENSRNKVLDRLDLSNVDVIPVVFKVPLEICIQRNNLREGRERVPESVITNMYKSFLPVSFGEKHAYKSIIVNYVKEGV